jgi:hypothetical protein
MSRVFDGAGDLLGKEGFIVFFVLLLHPQCHRVLNAKGGMNLDCDCFYDGSGLQ